MKKILIFCMYCVVFTIIPAVSVLAQGEKEKKPFPAQKVPVDEGDVYYVSGTDPADEEDFFIISETDDFKTDESPSVPEVSAGKDRYAQNGGEAGAEAAAEPVVTAAPLPPPQPVQPPQPQPTQPQPTQPQPPQPPPPAPQSAPSRAQPQPQPPVRTIAPTVNIIMPPAAQPAAPPAYTPSMKVIPGMPDPNGNGVYRVQLGAFSNTGLAERCFNRLKSAGFTPYYEQYGKLYRVVITEVKAADMVAVICRLEAAGFTEAWIREER